MSAPLDTLHDFYQPPPPAWTPQTVGWYVIFALLAVLLLWLAVRCARRWKANAYRREALREVEQVPMEELSALLKRTALAAWPREKVAPLSGAVWLQFLSETTEARLFDSAPANRVEEIAIRTVTLSDTETEQIRRAAAEWIRRHRVHA